MRIIKGILFGLLCFATAVAIMLFETYVDFRLYWAPSLEIVVVGPFISALVSALLGFKMARQSKKTGEIGDTPKRFVVGMLCFSLIINAVTLFSIFNDWHPAVETVASIFLNIVLISTLVGYVIPINSNMVRKIENIVTGIFAGLLCFLTFRVVWFYVHWVLGREFWDQYPMLSNSMLPLFIITSVLLTLAFVKKSNLIFIIALIIIFLAILEMSFGFAHIIQLRIDQLRFPPSL